jgi:acyl-CoA dehydrogenase
MTQPSPAVPDASALQARRRDVRAFLADFRDSDGFTPQCDGWVSAWSPAFSQALAERGLLGLTIPSSYGGRGGSPVERHVVAEELLVAGAPVAYHWFADRQLAPALLRYGTEEQKTSYLPRVAAGRLSFAIGLSEPEAGSDLASVRTTATPVPGGWSVTGVKLWTSNAHRADLISVLARSEPTGSDRRHGLTQFLVDLPQEGVNIRPVLQNGGDHHFNEVHLDNVFVPDTRVLGSPGQGWQQVTSELAWERSGPERFLSTYPLLAAALGTVDAGARPATVAIIGDLFSQLWTLHHLSLSVARALAGGAVPAVEAALVKDLGTQFEVDVIEAVRVMAGNGSAASDQLRPMLDAALRSSPGFTIRGGTSEVLRGIVAKSLATT